MAPKIYLFSPQAGLQEGGQHSHQLVFLKGGLKPACGLLKDLSQWHQAGWPQGAQQGYRPAPQQGGWPQGAQQGYPAAPQQGGWPQGAQQGYPPAPQQGGWPKDPIKKGCRAVVMLRARILDNEGIRQVLRITTPFSACKFRLSTFRV